MHQVKGQGLARVADVERSFADGEAIVREGDPGREMFVIKAGAAIVRRKAGGEVARLGRGDFFGEMSLLESLPRDADVIANGPTTVLVIGPGALLVLLRRDPSFGLELLQSLSRRVRSLNDRLGG
jgi:CRP-like cAMP-binding protein